MAYGPHGQRWLALHRLKTQIAITGAKALLKSTTDRDQAAVIRAELKRAQEKLNKLK